MPWFSVEVLSGTTGPSWRTLRIPDQTPIRDKFLVQAEDGAKAERMALDWVEELKGRSTSTVSSARPLDVSESVVHVSTTLGDPCPAPTAVS